MNIITRYILLLFVTLCSILAFSQTKEKPEVIYVPYADTISQELVDYIRSRTKPYILTYHYDMRHLIPEMRCRIQRAKRIGVFSVSKDKQVSFSQGNLQYHRKRYEWRFANNQYDYIGEGNIKDGQLADRIDLFGWSSDNSKAPFGVSTSKKASDYQGEFVDWGTNEIQGDAVGVWRTLSSDEWIYLFEKRKNAKQLYSKGSIDGLRGLIVLPDDCVLPEGLDFTAEPDNVDMDLDINVYTLAQWKKMEDAGAVFLCPTGRRDGTSIDYLLYYGGYWSSS